MNTVNIFLFVALTCFLQFSPLNALETKKSNIQNIADILMNNSIDGLGNLTAVALEKFSKSRLERDDYDYLLKTLFENLNEARANIILRKSTHEVISSPNSLLAPELVEMLVNELLPNKDSIFKANILHDIVNHKKYKTLDSALQLKVSEAIKMLPSYLQHLFFKQHFCLLNAEYSSYIYTAIIYTNTSKMDQIWLWNNTATLDKTSYLKVADFDWNSVSDGKMPVALKGTKYNMYYYRNESTKLLNGWNAEGYPSNYEWNIVSVDDDRVRFIQNDYIMCALDEYNKQRRDVGVLELSSESENNCECIWNLLECPV